MQVCLSLQEKLKDERVNRHMTLAELEEATGISHSTLGKYESDDCTDISPFNLAKLAKFYGVSMDYLMGLTENKKHPNTALYELHLSDSAVDVLKDGRFNHRLLSEIICHPGFIRLMTDIEVCVDRIADIHIRDLNLLLEKNRQAIQKKYHPDENDLAMRTLELACVDEDIFYKDVIHRDLDALVVDIRTAHRDDATTADDESWAEGIDKEIAPMVQEALQYEGTADQRRAYLICRILKIDYDKLREEDQKSLARVLKRSPRLINVFSQRGRAIPPQKRRKKR